MQSNDICDYCKMKDCWKCLRDGCYTYFLGIEVEPVRHEKWTVRADRHYHCTGCDEEAHWVWTRDKQILSNYCPHCGATMDGDA